MTVASVSYPQGFEGYYPKDAFYANQTQPQTVSFGHASAYLSSQDHSAQFHSWQLGGGVYPSQIGSVSSAMSNLFPPFSRSSAQKVTNISKFLLFNPHLRSTSLANGSSLTVNSAASSFNSCPTLSIT